MSLKPEEPSVESDLRDKRFPKEYRLRKRSEFKRLHGGATQKIVTGVVIFYVCPSIVPELRLGLSVPKRVGNAVKRNFIKRRIREAFRETRSSFHVKYDIVATPRKGVLDKSFADYVQCFQYLSRRLNREARS